MIMRRRTGLGLVSPLMLVLIACFLAPVILMLPTSFREYLPGMGITPGSWTLDNYTQIVTDDYYREVSGGPSAWDCWSPRSRWSSAIRWR